MKAVTGWCPWLNEYQGILYRTDLINDADEQAAFMEEYGYALAAPRSRQQYYDQVAFFHRPDEDFYGNIAYGLRAGWINILHEALHFMYGVDIADRRHPGGQRQHRGGPSSAGGHGDALQHG